MSAMLPFAVTIPVLGHATRFETDCADVLDAVHESFAAWRASDAALATRDPFRVRMMLHDGDEGPARPRVRHRCPDDVRLFAHSAGSFGVSDPWRREAVACVTRALIADRDQFRTELLEALTLALLSAFDRHPVHAAALVHAGRALLLVAPSGTGKSTLAYVARRAGVRVLSEDRVWVQRTPALRVWGWPGGIHLRTDAAAHFGELQALVETPYRHGPPRVAVARDSGAATLVADAVTVCAVERAGGDAALERASGDRLAMMLERDVAPGFDRFPARHHHTVRAITRNGGWRLRLSRDPHAALPLLMQMLETTT